MRKTLIPLFGLLAACSGHKTYISSELRAEPNATTVEFTCMASSSGECVLRVKRKGEVTKHGVKAGARLVLTDRQGIEALCRSESLAVDCELKPLSIAAGGHSIETNSSSQ